MHRLEDAFECYKTVKNLSANLSNNNTVSYQQKAHVAQQRLSSILFKPNQALPPLPPARKTVKETAKPQAPVVPTLATASVPTTNVPMPIRKYSEKIVPVKKIEEGTVLAVSPNMEKKPGFKQSTLQSPSFLGQGQVSKMLSELQNKDKESIETPLNSTANSMLKQQKHF